MWGQSRSRQEYRPPAGVSRALHQDFKSMLVTSYIPLGWCVGFLGAFLRVLTRRVIAAALSHSRLLDPSQSAEDLGLSESDEDTWPE